MKQPSRTAGKPVASFSFSNLNRSAGILLHITSLPSSFGIGDLGPQAKAFADFLNRSSQTFWQLLPLSPTTAGQGNSPYSASSSMAGNPLLISPELLAEDGLLSEEDIAAYKIKETDKVDFEKAEENKRRMLEKAYANYCANPAALEKEFAAFSKQEAYWLDDFALYIVLKKENGDKQWSDWDKPFKLHNTKALKQFAAEHKEEVDKVKWQQMIFSRQWLGLKEYCNKLNIQLFGDMPFYVAYDSSDVWSHRDIFSVDKEGKQQFVAGTPPDAFNENGQLWGMPIFNWEVLKQRNYDWWINRMRKNLELFNLVRLDHFRAFAAYWQVKASEETALNGEWIKSPGKEFFTILKKELGEMPFVAEDLGHIDEPVYKLRDGFKLPGMNVLQFAFGDNMPKNTYIPHHHAPLAVVYTGTHDNNTTIGWFKTLPKPEKKNLNLYAGTKMTTKNVCEILSRMTYASVSKLAILPMQDILELDEKARMNIPSSGENNWSWCMTAKQMNATIEKKLKEWCVVYDRAPEE